MFDLLALAPLYWLYFDNPWVRINRFLSIFRLHFDVEAMSKLLNAVRIKVMDHVLCGASQTCIFSVCV